MEEHLLSVPFTVFLTMMSLCFIASFVGLYLSFKLREEHLVKHFLFVSLITGLLITLGVTLYVTIKP